MHFSIRPGIVRYQCEEQAAFARESSVFLRIETVFRVIFSQKVAAVRIHADPLLSGML